MKKTILFALVCMIICSITVFSQNNQLTEQEKRDGWMLLFDGKSFDGWRACNGTEMSAIWIIEDEAIKIIARSERPPREPGVRVPAADILYGAKKFSNFELSIDWKIGKGGNSGIFYAVVEIPERPIYTAGVEVQILDNWNASDNKITNHLAGSLYDMLPALPSNAKPSGEWNNIVIRIKDGHATHTQNGVVVCEYTIWTPEWYEMVANSKFKDWEHFQQGHPAKEGFIGLQDHQDFECWFRNIKIREL